MTSSKDWIALIEAAYDLEGGDQLWLDRLGDCARPLLDPGMIYGGWTSRVTPTTFKMVLTSKHVSGPVAMIARTLHFLASQEVIDASYRSGRVIGTSSEVTFRFPGRRKLHAKLYGNPSYDSLVAGGQSSTGLGVSFGVLIKEQRQTTAAEQARWSQIAAHLGAGLRLRASMKELDLDAEPVEAILDSGGGVHDARKDATVASARDALREAVRRIERARTISGRNDPDTAVENWQGLVEGRWSLVDRFDTDGKRFVVAVKNDPMHHDPRGLTPRERQVAEFVGLGRSTKEIGYGLGVSTSAVTNCTAQAQEKLGLTSRVELAAFFSPGGLRAKLAEVAVKGERLLVGTYPLVNPSQVEKLTDAEREVVTHLVAGSTNSDIARRRGTSESTVANQIQSIFFKLGVHSRSELAARLQTPR
jgi:DNA-binding NarL/FixJ family response regulator